VCLQIRKKIFYFPQGLTNLKEEYDNPELIWIKIGQYEKLFDFLFLIYIRWDRMSKKTSHGTFPYNSMAKCGNLSN
jgi:hypothetical protein